MHIQSLSMDYVIVITIADEDRTITTHAYLP